LACSSEISKVADVASAGSAKLVIRDDASSSVLANVVLAESVRIWVGSISALVGSNEVDAEGASWAVVSTNSAVVGVGTAVGTVSDDASGETHWVVSARVVLDVADVVRVSDTNAVVTTGRVDARLVNSAVVEPESALVIVNTGVKWRSRLFVARVAVWTETSSGADLWWINLQTKELALVGVHIVANLRFWDTVVSSLLALVDVLAALLSALLVAEEIVGGHGVSIADETILADAVVSSESVARNADCVVVALVVARIAVAVWIWIR